MPTFNNESVSTGQLLRWDESKELVITPKFQRRTVWSEEAQAYLIDTILRGIPMPKIFLRRIYSEERGHNVYEVVDGQQRLRAILKFRAGKLELRPKHGLPYGAVTFDELPEPVQRQFTQYHISAEVMEDASDRDVWELFERLNTYTLTLIPQEKRNAEFFGAFKQTAYKLASDETEKGTWDKLKVFSNRGIARMREVELTSDVLVAIIVGIRDITYLDEAYKQYDDVFQDQDRDRAIDVFTHAIDYLVENLAEPIRATRFRNRTWFYSLMVAASDATKGIPKGQGPQPLQRPQLIGERMTTLDAALRPGLMSAEYTSLKNALSRQTSHIPPRHVRHSAFFDMLTLEAQAWQQRWSPASEQG